VAVLKATAVKVTVAPFVVVEAAERLIVTEYNTVVVVPLMVTAVEASAFPAVSLTKDEGFTVVVPTISVGEAPRVTVQIFKVLSQLTVGLVPYDLEALKSKLAFTVLAVTVVMSISSSKVKIMVSLALTVPPLPTSVYRFYILHRLFLCHHLRYNPHR
jgi:hypothetical protein